MGLPRLTTVTRPARRVFAAPDRDRERSRSIVVDSGNTDAGSTPTSTLRPGNVLGLVTSTGRFVEANDAAGDLNTPATVTALITACVAQQNDTISWSIDGGPTQTVVLGAGDDTDAEVATALNGNAIFAASLVADVVAARVRIRTLRAGAGIHLAVWDTDGTYFGTAAAPLTDVGSDADYVVIDEYVELDDNGTAVHNGAVGWLSGRFVRDNLINLTAEAEATLARRGSRFE